MGMHSHSLLIGVDVSKYRKEIRSNDKFEPYLENHVGYEMEIIDDSENNRFTYFGRVLSYGDLHAETDIVDFVPIAEKVAIEYKKLFGEEIPFSEIKIISCTIVW